MAREWFPGGCPLPQQSPKVIMLPNEVFALACRAYYEEQGLMVDEKNGQFAHCPYPEGMGETGYYLLWEHHQQQGLLQSKDVGKRCFWVGDTKKWLTTCDYWPDNYFDLWDIYESFSRPQHDISYLTKGDVNKIRLKNLREVMSKKPAEYWKKKVSRATEATKKKVKVTLPNGLVGTYPSIRFTALSLGVTHSAVSKWLSGFSNPRSGGYKVSFH